MNVKVIASILISFLLAVAAHASTTATGSNRDSSDVGAFVPPAVPAPTPPPAATPPAAVVEKGCRYNSTNKIQYRGFCPGGGTKRLCGNSYNETGDRYMWNGVCISKSTPGFGRGALKSASKWFGCGKGEMAQYIEYEICKY